MTTNMAANKTTDQMRLHHARQLRNVLCRLAILRDSALTCEIPACRRARICMGDDLRCIYKPFDPKRPIPDDKVRAWNELARQREQCHAALRRLRCDITDVS